MNIKEAKQEIKNTVKAYLTKDEAGGYAIPVERQRPLLLIGPPGIGKTAIMEQVAHECGINLVSYTITHHTRQSAIGLPFISPKEYGGKSYSVTEYTMSEIIASIYDQIEASGIREGILFLDEINCVSETLAPTMLQFLQYKTFGTHKVPEGFLIVTAGNPPQYNKSVRDFDIVTYDRVKRINIEADYPVWKEYAYRIGIHGAILSYLEIKKEHFYSMVTDLEGKRFVTARGWEDLSRTMKVYEQLELPVNYDFIVQYIQDTEIARDFAVYYELYHKYQSVYRIPQILEGDFPEKADAVVNAPFDEKLSLIGLLVDSLNQEFREYAKSLAVQKEVFAQLNYLREELKAQKATALEILRRQTDSRRQIYQHSQKAGMLSAEEAAETALALKKLDELIELLELNEVRIDKEDFTIIKSEFDKNESDRQKKIADTGRHLTNAFDFLARTYGEGQELVIFLSELSAGFYSLKFVSDCGNEAYYKYNRLLLLKDRKQELAEAAMELLGM